jgi:hypothetical protein
MPSYRATLLIDRMRPGVRADSALPTAVAAVNRAAKAEAYEIQVIDGRGAVVIRFAADHDDHARNVVVQVGEALAAVAVMSGATVHRRAGTNWVRLGPSYDDRRL